MAEDVTELLEEAGEGRFDRWRRTAGLFLGPIVFAVVWSLPLPALTPAAHRLAAVMGLVVVYWVTEALPLAATALLGAALAVGLGIAPAKEVLAPFAHPIIFLFIGSFIIARAMEKFGLQRRFALGILSLSGLAARPRLLFFCYGLFCAALSMFISNTAATALMFPIGLGLAATLGAGGGNGRNDRFTVNILLMTAFAASAGGLATPVGTPPNLIGIGLIEQATGYHINFFQWMTFGLPLVGVTYLYLFLTLGWRAFGKTVGHAEETRAYVARERAALGAVTAGERAVAVAFAVAVILWVLPGAVAVVAGPTSGAAKFLEERLPEGVVAVGAALLLFFLPVDWRERRFALTWGDAVAIDWGTILLFGGGMALGSLMMSTGLAAALGEALQQLTGARSLWAVTALAAALAVVLSEASSNTAAANVVIPPVMGMAVAAGQDPVIPALAACLGASFGFMLPVSTPPNAIVYGTGKVPLLKMVRAGVLLDLFGVAAVVGTLWALRYVLPGANG